MLSAMVVSVRRNSSAVNDIDLKIAAHSYKVWLTMQAQSQQKVTVHIKRFYQNDLLPKNLFFFISALGENTRFKIKLKFHSRFIPYLYYDYDYSIVSGEPVSRAQILCSQVHIENLPTIPLTCKIETLKINS